MMLVEARELERIKQKSVRDSNPKLAVLSRLRDEMDIVLRNPFLSAAQKVTLFTKLMNRFKALQAESGTKGSSSPTAIPMRAADVQPAIADDDTLTNISTSPDETEIDNSIVQFRPKVVRVSDSFKNRASSSGYDFDEAKAKARASLNESMRASEEKMYNFKNRMDTSAYDPSEVMAKTRASINESRNDLDEIQKILERRPISNLEQPEDVIESEPERESKSPAYSTFAKNLMEKKQKRKITRKLKPEGVKPATRFQGKKHVKLHKGGTMIPPGKRYNKQRGGIVKHARKSTRVLRIY